MSPAAWLGVDQSLASSGWVLIRDGVAKASGVIKTEPSSYSGIADSLYRTQQLTEMFSGLLCAEGPAHIACEYPAVGGRRTDASLLAASALWTASRHLGFTEVTIVSAQRVRKVFGATNKASLKEKVSEQVDHSACRFWNQHVTDAAGVALCAKGGWGTKVVF